MVVSGGQEFLLPPSCCTSELNPPEILSRNIEFNDFEVTHEFASIGWRSLRLNARRFFDEAGKSELILLAMGSLPTARCTTRPAPAPENLHLTLKEELDA